MIYNPRLNFDAVANLNMDHKIKINLGNHDGGHDIEMKLCEDMIGKNMLPVAYYVKH